MPPLPLLPPPGPAAVVGVVVAGWVGAGVGVFRPRAVNRFRSPVWIATFSEGVIAPLSMPWAIDVDVCWYTVVA